MKNGWREGTIGIPTGKELKGKATICYWWVKDYEEPSEYGINGGKIRKLKIMIDGKTVCKYDIGWNVKPTCKEAEIALSILLNAYN